jgi:hypothetical protein
MFLGSSVMYLMLLKVFIHEDHGVIADEALRGFFSQTACGR